MVPEDAILTDMDALKNARNVVSRNLAKALKNDVTWSVSKNKFSGAKSSAKNVPIQK